MKNNYFTFLIIFAISIVTNTFAANLGDNDICTAAIAINCNDTIVGTTVDNTDTGFNDAPDEYFIFTGDGFEQEITVTMCDGGTNYDSFLRVFLDCSLTNQIASNDDACGLQSELEFTSDGTSSYIIMVEGFAANSGDFSLSISCTGPPIPPPNDLIENAIDISDVLQNATAGEFIDPAVNAPDATPEDGLPNDCDLAGIDGFWYQFTVNGGFVVNASIESPLGISAVIFFTAPNDTATLEDLTRVDDTSNPCFTGDNAEITANTALTYYIFAANKGGITDFNFFFGALGIEESAFNSFTLYPNPSQNELFLSAEAPIEAIAITNILGQTVIANNTMSTRLTQDISRLNVGTYFISVTIEGATNTYQFIKK